MPNPARLEAFTLYLDPQDPEDVAMIRYLQLKRRRKKASAEIRTAMLLYMELLKGNNLTPSARSMLAGHTDYQANHQLLALDSSLSDSADELPADSAKQVLQAAKRSFMKK